VAGYAVGGALGHTSADSKRGKFESTLELVTAQNAASCNPAEQRKF